MDREAFTDEPFAGTRLVDQGACQRARDEPSSVGRGHCAFERMQSRAVLARAKKRQRIREIPRSKTRKSTPPMHTDQH
jgi:hypothetical protein